MKNLTEGVGRGTERATSKKTVLQWDQLCSLSPPAGGCAELVAMRKIAPPRIKYHWNTAQHSTESTQVTGHSKIHTARCKTRQSFNKRAQTSQVIGHNSEFSVQIFPNMRDVFTPADRLKCQKTNKSHYYFFMRIHYVSLKFKNELWGENIFLSSSVTQRGTETQSWVST